MGRPPLDVVAMTAATVTAEAVGDASATAAVGRSDAVEEGAGGGVGESVGSGGAADDALTGVPTDVGAGVGRAVGVAVFTGAVDARRVGVGVALVVGFGVAVAVGFGVADGEGGEMLGGPFEKDHPSTLPGGGLRVLPPSGLTFQVPPRSAYQYFQNEDAGGVPMQSSGGPGLPSIRHRKPTMVDTSSMVNPAFLSASKPLDGDPGAHATTTPPPSAW